jgi:hypothetical protein
MRPRLPDTTHHWRAVGSLLARIAVRHGIRPLATDPGPGLLARTIRASRA